MFKLKYVRYLNIFTNPLLSCSFIYIDSPLSFTNSSMWWLALIINTTQLRITWKEVSMRNFVYIWLSYRWITGRFLNNLIDWGRLSLMRIPKFPRHWDINCIRMNKNESKQASKHASSKSINSWSLDEIVTNCIKIMLEGLSCNDKWWCGIVSYIIPFFYVSCCHVILSQNQKLNQDMTSQNSWCTLVYICKYMCILHFCFPYRLII